MKMLQEQQTIGFPILSIHRICFEGDMWEKFAEIDKSKSHQVRLKYQAHKLKKDILLTF